MAGQNSPEDAVAAFVERFGRTLSCVVRGVAVASGARPNAVHTITHYTEGQNVTEPARLWTHGGQGEILLQIKHHYEVAADTGGTSRDHFGVRTTFYHYDLLDRDGKEVVVYHWEPDGISPVRLPHLHVPAAGSIILPQRAGSALTHRRTHLGKFHLLTGRVLIEDVIEVLIREFGAVPLRADWERILSEGRTDQESTI